VSSHQEKTPGWLDWYDGPSKPHFVPPPGSVDAHCHVFGPSPDFPFAPERKYTPCNASKDQLFALRDHLSFSRNVIVQATCHGADNSAMVDACRASGGRARGVATVKRSVSDEQLQALHDAGVRGVRFNFLKRLVDTTPPDELLEIAGRVAPLGWHVVLYFEAVDLPELLDFFNVANDLRYLVALTEEHSQFVLVYCSNFLRSSLRHNLKVTVYLRPNRGHVFARLSLLRV